MRNFELLFLFLCFHKITPETVQATHVEYDAHMTVTVTTANFIEQTNLYLLQFNIFIVKMRTFIEFREPCITITVAVCLQSVSTDAGI